MTRCQMSADARPIGARYRTYIQIVVAHIVAARFWKVAEKDTFVTPSPNQQSAARDFDFRNRENGNLALTIASQCAPFQEK